MRQESRLDDGEQNDRRDQEEREDAKPDEQPFGRAKADIRPTLVHYICHGSTCGALMVMEETLQDVAFGNVGTLEMRSNRSLMNHVDSTREIENLGQIGADQ